MPGYHLHFVTEDLKQGGHLLECNLQEGTAQIDTIREFYMLLPDGSDFAQANLTADRKDEFEKIESK